MSNTSNRAGANPEAYKEALRALLADRSPMDVLAATPGELGQLTTSLGQGALARPEAPEKWSLLQVVQHLVDSELMYAIRLRKVIAEEEPVLEGYDQDVWLRRLHDPTEPVELLLGEFEVARRLNLRFLERCSAADLERAGRHGERGLESVSEMMVLYAGHDLVHLRQASRIRESLDSR